MTRSRFEATFGAETLEPGQRRFCQCYKCKKRWVSEATVKVQPGFTITSWMNSKGGWESERFPTTQRRLHRIHQNYCPHCGYDSFSAKTVDGSHNPDRKCDDRCLTAKGPKCECSCSGANHGAGIAISLAGAA